MIITPQDIFRNVIRISRLKFNKVLMEKASSYVLLPKLLEQYYDVIVAAEIDPLFILAMFNHESSMGNKGLAVTTHSWGNTGFPIFGPVAIGTINHPMTGKAFPIYENFLDGLLSTLWRLNSPNWKYYNRSRIIDLFIHPSGNVWAPAGDMNNPDGYVRAVVDFMNQYTDKDKMIRLALASGHHNSDGGNPTEYIQTGKLTQAIAAQARNAGLDVVVVTPLNGLGQFNGGIWDVARAVSNLVPAPDYFIETHTESGPRGVFVIYPDWGTDVDTDVRDKLGPAIARKVSIQTGLPIRGNGVMSEKATGVGRSGSRLGIFNKTDSLAEVTTRMIVEYGSHDQDADLAIINSPGFYENAAIATINSILEFEGIFKKMPDAAELQRQLLFSAVANEFPGTEYNRYLGTLQREGAILDKAYGTPIERLAIYEKQRLHTWQGLVQAFLLDGPTSYDSLLTDNRIILY